MRFTSLQIKDCDSKRVAPECYRRQARAQKRNFVLNAVLAFIAFPLLIILLFGLFGK